MVVGLIRGRHNLPSEVTEYIWDDYSISDVTDVFSIENYAKKWIGVRKPDELTVYVTGLTVALVAVINACHEAHIPLYLMHFNRDTRSYYPQVVK